MKRLIVNADDFGMAPGVNRAILEAHRTGIVTSTSLMANGAAFDEAAAAARATPSLGVGLHLNLTQGRPLSGALSLGAMVGADGGFLGNAERLYFQMVAGRVSMQAAEREIRAQIECLQDAGIQPTHVDGHQHAHMWPPLFELVARLATEYGVPGVRVSRERRAGFRALWRRNSGFRSKIVAQAGVGLGLAFLSVASHAAFREAGAAAPDFFYGVTATGYLDRAVLESVLRDVPDGISELMCHPGYVDATLERVETRLVRQREMELEAVASPAGRDLAARLGIELVTYRALAAA